MESGDFLECAPGIEKRSGSGFAGVGGGAGFCGIGLNGLNGANVVGLAVASSQPFDIRDNAESNRENT